ncbi:MAG: 2'-5' RNA ligase family protein [Bacteriovoracaceae bacterium]|nr:2'-5' RNA ligase family protein [Bacteriovoracaceae bacterium]
MKKLIALLLITIPLISFGVETSFNLAPEVHNNTDFDFIPHHGGGRFGTYLTMDVNFEPMKNLFEQLSSVNPNRLKTRGEAHITVLTPIEYFDVLKEKVSMTEIDQIALDYNIQASEFEIVCLGRGTAQLGNNEEETFYVVVNSEDLINIRRVIQELFVSRGGDADAFNPESYYPHITLGFSKRDLHESDGVIKNSQSCYADLY